MLGPLVELYCSANGSPARINERLSPQTNCGSNSVTFFPQLMIRVRESWECVVIGEERLTPGLDELEALCGHLLILLSCALREALEKEVRMAWGGHQGGRTRATDASASMNALSEISRITWRSQFLTRASHSVRAWETVEADRLESFPRKTRRTSFSLKGKNCGP